MLRSLWALQWISQVNPASTGNSLRLVTQDLVYCTSFSGTTSNTLWGKPELERQKLRLVLLESLPKISFYWGCQVKNVDKDCYFHFVNDIRKRFDLVVGVYRL